VNVFSAFRHQNSVVKKLAVGLGPPDGGGPSHNTASTMVNPAPLVYFEGLNHIAYFRNILIVMLLVATVNMLLSRMKHLRQALFWVKEEQKVLTNSLIHFVFSILLNMCVAQNIANNVFVMCKYLTDSWNCEPVNLLLFMTFMLTNKMRKILLK